MRRRRAGSRWAWCLWVLSLGQWCGPARGAGPGPGSGLRGSTRRPPARCRRRHVAERPLFVNKEPGGGGRPRPESQREGAGRERLRPGSRGAAAMDATWSSFIFQTAGADQTPGVQADLLPMLTTASVSQEAARPPSTPGAVEGPLAPEMPKNPQPQARPSLEPDKSKPKSKGPFVCRLCSKEFKNNYNLRRHQGTHSGAGGRGQLPASTNPPTMVPIALLSMTMAGGAGGPLGSAAPLPLPADSGLSPAPSPSPARRVRKNHSCELCGKAFRDVYHLNRHKLSHSDEKPFECPVCQQRFKRKDRMSYHVRSHEGGVNKPYICSHCGKGFSRPDHLNSHVRQVHSTERPFKCQTCEAAFATKDRLRAHMIRHEEKVPCHVCGKLLSAAYITDHMKVHSEGPNHTCDICSKGSGESCPLAAAVAPVTAPPRPAEGVGFLNQALSSPPW